MAKIDCSVTVNFLRECERMCNNLSCGSGCPVFRLAREDSASCGYYLSKHPEFAVEVIQAWSDEHPVKTRLDDLLEKYPKVYISSGNTPSIRPYMLGYCENCDDCVYSHCEAEVCWNEPVDGGATGTEAEQ